jgi:hypothetical protein
MEVYPKKCLVARRQFLQSGYSFLLGVLTLNIEPMNYLFFKANVEVLSNLDESFIKEVFG